MTSQQHHTPGFHRVLLENSSPLRPRPAPSAGIGKDSEHLLIGLRIRVLEQALIFHLLDYRRQHLASCCGWREPTT
jgi:hypothetical protein